MKPRRIILFRFFVLLFVIPAADAAVPDAARQPWDETVKAAEKEGAVSVYFWQGGNLDKAIGIFQKKFPALRLHAVGGRGSAFMNRIVTEMRAGKHLADVCFCGVTSPYELLHKQAAALDSIKNAFVLREVTEASKWWQGKLHFRLLGARGEHARLLQHQAREPGGIFVVPGSPQSEMERQDRRDRADGIGRRLARALLQARPWTGIFKAALYRDGRSLQPRRPAGDRLARDGKAGAGTFSRRCSGGDAAGASGR
jgi:hypothetical protein